jgi:hypothetical protein
MVPRNTYWPEPLVDLNNSPEIATIRANIRSAFLSGTPLFTKECIRHVCQQLRELNGKAGKVYVKGLNGNIVEFPVEPGRVRSLQDRDIVL